jgi:hypothetical protein
MPENEYYVKINQSLTNNLPSIGIRLAGFYLASQLVACQDPKINNLEWVEQLLVGQGCTSLTKINDNEYTFRCNQSSIDFVKNVISNNPYLRIIGDLQTNPGSDLLTFKIGPKQPSDTEDSTVK